MRIKIFAFCSLFLIWICLIGIPAKLSEVLQAILVSTIIYLLTIYLKILPKKIALNYKAILYFGWLLSEIFKASFSVIKIIWGKNIKIEPTFEWVDAGGLSGIGEVIYGNSITLTPGTVTLDINNNMLLVHALDKSLIEDLQKGEMRERVKKILY